MELKMHGINWYERGDTLDVIDCYDKEIELFGEDDAGNEYSAVGMESCDEIVDVDKDSIECLVKFTEKWPSKPIDIEEI